MMTLNAAGLTEASQGSIKGFARGGGVGVPTPNERQSDVIYLDAEKDQVVLGTAGSGKTLMAVYRAKYLSDPGFPHAGRTLLVTFNKALASYLTHLAGTSPQLDVRVFHHFTRGYLSSRGLLTGYNVIAQGTNRYSYLDGAVQDAARAQPTRSFFRRELEFFMDELDWISGHGYSEKDSYLEANRVGRVKPLSPIQREMVWLVRERYLARRNAGKQYFDWWELPTAVRRGLAVDRSERLYRYVVVDEAQDFPPEALRALVEAVAPGGSVTLFADYAQQLYGQRTSFAASGIRVNKVERFQENFRNNVGIARLAIATAALPHFTDSADLVVPTTPAVRGTAPTLYRAPDAQQELATVRARAAELGRTGSVAVLAQTWEMAASAVRGLPDVRSLKGEPSQWANSHGVYAGTYHSAKGLEFDGVIMPFLNSTQIPNKSNVAAFGEAEAMEREARQLYVGITRARDELLATYVDEFTTLLPGPSSGFWLVGGNL